LKQFKNKSSKKRSKKAAFNIRYYSTASFYTNIILATFDDGFR